MKGNHSEGGKNEFVMLLLLWTSFLLVKIKWKTFLEAAGADCYQNDGFTGPLVQSSMKISGKRGENNEDYETKFSSSPPLLLIVIYRYCFPLLLNHPTILGK